MRNPTGLQCRQFSRFGKKRGWALVPRLAGATGVVEIESEWMARDCELKMFGGRPESSSAQVSAHKTDANLGHLASPHYPGLLPAGPHFHIALEVCRGDSLLHTTVTGITAIIQRLQIGSLRRRRARCLIECTEALFSIGAQSFPHVVMSLWPSVALDNVTAVLS